MKYIITENRLVDFVDKYLKDVVGNLRRFEMDHVNAREGDFELIQDSGWKVFVYSDYHLEVDSELFDRTKDLFNLDTRETEKLFEKWFDRTYPGNLVISAYRSMD